MSEITPAPTSAPRQGGILTLSIKDKSALYAAYMPFVIGGGLFIPTSREYKMGQEVFVLLIMEDAERLPIAGKVVWKTPSGSEVHRIEGIGVQFNGKDSKSIDVRNKIENYLAGALDSDRPTHTM
ncbi:pilus assembly protein PilZ [Crenothrix sp. D3]|jgi:type IV pilus assembly protein PilZ|nr:pilus assembly protein PilZ [Crenothrix sp. D3]